MAYRSAKRDEKKPLRVSCVAAMLATRASALVGKIAGHGYCLGSFFTPRISLAWAEVAISRLSSFAIRAALATN